ncbi:hypothetical protein [Rossellomorea vietnamensis]|nr:hypothetical protein [Rossellomorea vietnamensis]
MKRRFLTILTASILLLGFAGTTSAAGTSADANVTTPQTDLPGWAY